MAALHTACASLQGVVDEPEVRLAGLELVSAGLTEQRFAADLEVHNPNSFRLPVRSFTWDVSVEGVALADGVSDREIDIPAGATERVRLQFDTNLLASAVGLADRLREPGETLTYRIEGELRADLPLIGALPYSHEGTVELRRP